MAPYNLRSKRGSNKVLIAQSDKPAQSTQTKRAKNAKNQRTRNRPRKRKSPPTTFLSLPREIRQKILYESYSSGKLVITNTTTINPDRYLDLSPAMRQVLARVMKRCDMSNLRYCMSLRASYHQWSDILKEVNPIVAEDLEYVHEKKIRDANFVGIYRECNGGERQLVIHL